MIAGDSAGNDLRKLYSGDLPQSAIYLQFRLIAVTAIVAE